MYGVISLCWIELLVRKWQEKFSIKGYLLKVLRLYCNGLILVRRVGLRMGLSVLIVPCVRNWQHREDGNCRKRVVISTVSFNPEILSLSRISARAPL